MVLGSQQFLLRIWTLSWCGGAVISPVTNIPGKPLTLVGLSFLTWITKRQLDTAAVPFNDGTGLGPLERKGEDRGLLRKAGPCHRVTDSPSEVWPSCGGLGAASPDGENIYGRQIFLWAT